MNESENGNHAGKGRVRRSLPSRSGVATFQLNRELLVNVLECLEATHPEESPGWRARRAAALYALCDYDGDETIGHRAIAKICERIPESGDRASFRRLEESFGKSGATQFRNIVRYGTPEPPVGKPKVPRKKKAQPRLALVPAHKEGNDVNG